MDDKVGIGFEVGVASLVLREVRSPLVRRRRMMTGFFRALFHGLVDAGGLLVEEIARLRGWGAGWTQPVRRMLKKLMIVNLHASRKSLQGDGVFSVNNPGGTATSTGSLHAV